MYFIFSKFKNVFFLSDNNEILLQILLFYKFKVVFFFKISILLKPLFDKFKDII